MIAGREVAATRMVVRPLHRPQLRVDLGEGELLPRLEQQHLETQLGEHVCRHAARGSRTDDDGIVRLGQVDFLIKWWCDLDQGHLWLPPWPLFERLGSHTATPTRESADP